MNAPRFRDAPDLDGPGREPSPPDFDSIADGEWSPRCGEPLDIEDEGVQTDELGVSSIAVSRLVGGAMIGWP